MFTKYLQHKLATLLMIIGLVLSLPSSVFAQSEEVDAAVNTASNHLFLPAVQAGSATYAQSDEEPTAPLIGSNHVFLQAMQPNVKPGELIAVNATEDRCYQKGPNGQMTRVKCPDVIVAKPKPSTSDADIDRLVATKAAAKQFVPRLKIRGLRIGERVLIGGEALAGGTYICYNENPPNSGHFDRVVCPDVIVLET